MKVTLTFLAVLLCAYENKHTSKRLKFSRWLIIQILKIYEWKVFNYKKS